MTKIGQYEIGKEIGKGSFAVVYKCWDTNTQKSVAIKSIIRSKLKSKKLIENLEIEISILKSLKHPHIVELIDYQQSSNHFHLIMDYCSMGDLSYFIRKKSQLTKTHPVINSLLERYPLPPGSHGLHHVLVLHFLKQLSNALEFLRSKSLVHRDIKPQNLLLCPPLHNKLQFIDMGYVGLWELPILKIADFGFARFLPSTSMAETLCGSPLYMAPEILRYEKYNAKADLWSVGAVLYEMTVGKSPFKAANHIELLKTIEKSNDKIKFPASAQVSDDLKRLIRSLLKYNPTERVSFNEFFNDCLIKDDIHSFDKPLESSLVDENLFISEYISPLPEMTSNTTPKSTTTTKTTTIKTTTIKTTNKPAVDDLQEEHIKDLITGLEMLHNLEHSAVPLLVSRKDDVFLEKDYVVVEKRAVEVNAIADELAKAGSGLVAMNPRRTSSNSSTESKSQFKKYNSRDKRTSISISPTNALTRAIGLASHRLFGPGDVDDIAGTVVDVHSLLKAPQIPISTTSDGHVLYHLETIATKAHAINLFADVKFSQLIPSPPSDEEIHQDVLPAKIVRTISEEGVALYVKTLSLLAKGMATASEWWYSQEESEQAADLTTLVQINKLVQWIRDKFNESLERAEFIKLRLQELGEDDGTGEKVIAEKLIFDRALEMSRNAAVNELIKEDLHGCELSYSTSIWMLESLLEDDDKLDLLDKMMIEKFIVSIGNRLNVLKRKINRVEIG